MREQLVEGDADLLRGLLQEVVYAFMSEIDGIGGPPPGADDEHRGGDDDPGVAR